MFIFKVELTVQNWLVVGQWFIIDGIVVVSVPAAERKVHWTDRNRVHVASITGEAEVVNTRWRNGGKVDCLVP